jgi:hypothetical protein
VFNSLRLSVVVAAEVLTEIAAEVLTEIAAEVDLVVALALTLIVVAAIRKEGSIHSLTGVFLLPYNN